MNDAPNQEATRRHFLFSAGVLAATASVAPASAAEMIEPEERQDEGDQDEAADSEREITLETIAEAEKIAGIEFTPTEREMLIGGVRQSVRGYVGRREHELPNGVGPASAFDCRLPGMTFPEQGDFTRSDGRPTALPLADEDIAFAPIADLSRWIASGQLASERLTKIYLDRLQRFGPALECNITITSDRALRLARRADRELAAGKYRGPLHGIPWGAKDLLDTAGILTTWGANPYKERVPDEDAAVVRLLDDAGAVLVAKLTLGALAMGDHWYGGQTRNPFNIEQGSSGSSAGSAAATAAGLVGFGIGTETLGSIVSPCMQCGTTGLRPTFGRVPRTGAMALCWSLDKIGPICRRVEDAILVLDAIKGADPGDPSSVDMALNFDGNRSPRGLRVGYSPAWFEGRRVSDIDKNALTVLKSTGVEMVEIEIPEWPYGSLMSILNVEASAAFEELTLSNRDDELKRQGRGAWPNSFRQARLVPAVELVQAQRFRRQVMEMMAEQFADLDAMFGPSYAGGMLLITNNTGHPSLTIRAGFRDNGTPRGVTLIGNLFDEGTICTIGMAMERKLNVADVRPALT